MNNPVLFLGIEFPNLWLFIMLLCFCCVYIVVNIVPAFGCLHKIMKERDGLLYAPLYFLLCLIPFYGTVFASLFYDFGQKSNNIMLLLVYIVIICFIGCLVNL